MPALDHVATRWIRLRLGLCAVLFLTLLAVVMVRAVYLQVLQGDELGDLARDQYLRELALSPRRGAILDARGIPLAISLETDSVFVDAKSAGKEQKDARDQLPVDAKGLGKLARALKMDLAPVAKKFAQKSAFVWLKRRVTPTEAQEVSRLGLKGVGLVKEFRRFFPQKELASHILGTVGIDSEGLEGVERAQDAALRGSMQEVHGFRDVRGNVLFQEPGVPTGALGGATVQLTIDSAIQRAAEVALADGAAKAKAAAGVALVMDPQTGAILALANVPTFNPNAPGDQLAARRNRSVTDQYEPGSTMKCFMMAAALTEKLIRPDTLVDVTDGELQIGRKKIRDSHKPEENAETATRVLATSSNVGSARIGLKLGAERLVGWLHSFGFGERTGVGLPGEARGVLQDPQRMGEIATATTAFGQGMAATPLQVVTALSALANGGLLMRPFVVSKVTRADGEVLLERKPEPVRQVVTKEVARTVTTMMKAVVATGGTGTLAAVPGFTVAGKTGTAQKADPLTHGYGDKRYSSFMGFVPADAPRLAIYIALDEPQADVYGGKIAAPIFREIASAALQQLNVSPEKPQTLELAVLRRDAPKKKGAKAEVKVVESEEGTPFDEGFVDDESGLADAAPPGALVVPDLKGLSARAALRILGERALEADLEGSGRATTQKPEAGRLVPPGTRVHVVLGSG